MFQIPSDRNRAKATREDVEKAYVSLLGRQPESADVFDKYYRDKTTVDVLKIITTSLEFKHRFGVDGADQLFREGPFWNFTSTFDPISQIVTNIAPDRLPLEGHIVNFLGVAMNVKFMDTVSHRGGQLDEIPIPANYHADMAEWGSVLRSIELAQGSYNIVELGCGWGCWINNTGAVCRRKGLDFAAVGVEGDAGHLTFARSALRTNGIREESCRLIHGVAGNGGYALFPRQDRAGASWGLEPFFTTDRSEYKRRMQTGAYEAVPVVTLKEAFRDFERVDLLHVDIQGGELPLVSNNVPLLNERVAYMFIGTHSRAIEGKLIDVMACAGWQLECERPAVFTIGERTLNTLIDGVQAWRNVRL